MLFARRAIKGYNKPKYNDTEQKILDLLVDYYKKLSCKLEKAINNRIVDYFMQEDDDAVEEEKVIPEVVKQEKVVHEAITKPIKLEKVL